MLVSIAEQQPDDLREALANYKKPRYQMVSSP